MAVDAIKKAPEITEICVIVEAILGLAKIRFKNTQDGTTECGFQGDNNLHSFRNAMLGNVPLIIELSVVEEA